MLRGIYCSPDNSKDRAGTGIVPVGPDRARRAAVLCDLFWQEHSVLEFAAEGIFR